MFLGATRYELHFNPMPGIIFGSTLRRLSQFLVLSIMLGFARYFFLDQQPIISHQPQCRFDHFVTPN
jgi:hypothetical protein